MLPKVSRRLLGPVWTLALVAVCLEARAGDPIRAPSMRLRIEWSTEKSAVWTGRLAVKNGSLDRPLSLGLARDDAGTISVDEEGTLSIQRRSARSFDGLEVGVTTSPGARLEFEVHDKHGTGKPQSIHFSPVECFHKSRTFAAEGDRPRVIIRRVPGDALAVILDRPHLVFDPEETFRTRIALNLLDARDGPDKAVRALLKWKLQPAGGNRTITDGSTTVAALVNPTHAVEVPLELRLPHEEGVYNLRLAATGLGFTDVERAVQLVIVDPNHAGRVVRGGAPEKPIDAFEPAAAGLFRKAPANALRPGHEHARSRFLRFRRGRDEPDEEVATASDFNTQAYKLRISHPGHAHRLELVVPPGKEQSLTIALLQADDQDRFVPCGPECSFSVSAPKGGTGPAAEEGVDENYVHRQIFWPQDRDTVVSISSRRPGAPIDIARVKVFDLGEDLSAGPVAGSGASGVVPPGGRPRLVGRYLHKPFIAGNFAATQVIDPSERLAVDDWQTFLLAGRRVTEYLRFDHSTALMLAVYADGAMLYPSQFVEPSLAYDNGRLASNGMDPTPKDVFELLLRLFDRRGLALVPELQFDAPLPELERRLDERNAAQEELLLVDGEGRTRRASQGVASGGRPGYNVLSPVVQQAVLDVVGELLERYASRPSLAGVAFELSPDSFLQLPGIEWGYDRDTIRRFESVARTRVPRGDGTNWRAEAHRFLTTTARREWLRFRCGEVARFHLQLVELVAQVRPDARIIFSGHLSALGDSESETTVLEVVRSGSNPAQVLLGQGLDFAQPLYTTEHLVTVLRPYLQNAAADHLGQAALATFNHSPVIDALYRSGRGGLVYSISSADLPWGSEAGRGGDARALTPASPPWAGPRRYTHLLATQDAQVVFDGGAILPLTIDDALWRPRLTISRLPDIPFQAAGPQIQPVAVRAAHVGGATCVYAANDSPLAATIELVLDCPAATICQALDSGRKLSLVPEGGPRKCRLPVELGAYGLFACRLDRGGVEVLETRLRLSDGPLEDVHQRIYSLSARMNTVASLARAGSRSLSNPGFEQAGSGARELPGWELSVVNAGWRLDEDNPRSGQRSLQLSAEGRRAALESPELALDGSRFVTMTLWMRSSKSAARVQMAFAAQIDGDDFRQEADVLVGKSWKQCSFRVDTLPPGHMQHARLSVKPLDSCKLWIDDVEIQAQSFSADEVRQLTKTLSSVKLAWEEGRYADCQRLLDGYWGQFLLSEPVAPPETSPARSRLSDRVKNMFRR